MREAAESASARDAQTPGLRVWSAGSGSPGIRALVCSGGSRGVGWRHQCHPASLLGPLARRWWHCRLTHGDTSSTKAPADEEAEPPSSRERCQGPCGPGGQGSGGCCPKLSLEGTIPRCPSPGHLALRLLCPRLSTGPAKRGAAPRGVRRPELSVWARQGLQGGLGLSQAGATAGPLLFRAEVGAPSAQQRKASPGAAAPPLAAPRPGSPHFPSLLAESAPPPRAGPGRVQGPAGALGAGTQEGPERS